MSELIEVDLGDGVISFDGRVVESFGFGEHEANRLHVSKIEKLDLKLAGKRALLQIKASKAGRIMAGGKIDAGAQTELESLVEAIRAAATGLGE